MTTRKPTRPSRKPTSRQGGSPAGRPSGKKSYAKSKGDREDRPRPAGGKAFTGRKPTRKEAPAEARPAFKGGPRPGVRPSVRPDARPDTRPDTRRADAPAGKYAPRPAAKADGRPAGKFAGKKSTRTTAKSSDKPFGKTAGRATGKAFAQSSGQARSARDDRNGQKSEPRDKRQADRRFDRSTDRQDDRQYNPQAERSANPRSGIRSGEHRYASAAAPDRRPYAASRDERASDRPAYGKPAQRRYEERGTAPRASGRPNKERPERAERGADYAARPASKFSGKFSGKPASKPMGRGASKFARKPEDQQADKPALKADYKPAYKAKSPVKPLSKAPARPRKPAPAPATEASSFEGERIAKYLARVGVASRREVERMIEAGRIKVNGVTLNSPARNVTANDLLVVDGNIVASKEPTRLWRYHKPAGQVTTAHDPQGRPTVFDALPAELGRVISVGRLDLNSEGLLLLTNNGELSRYLELPSTGWTRNYRVRVHGLVDQAKLDMLANGIEYEGVQYGPITATIEQTQDRANVWIDVSLKEGKNREIRKVMEAIDLKVNRLLRVSYGPFQLGNLPAGALEAVPARVLKEQFGKVLEL